MEGFAQGSTLQVDRRKEDLHMATRQEDISRATVRTPGIDVARIVRAGFSKTSKWFDALMLGGATPRRYRREGFPEVELHQVMSGRKDRFDRE